MWWCMSVLIWKKITNCYDRGLRLRYFTKAMTHVHVCVCVCLIFSSTPVPPSSRAYSRSGGRKCSAIALFTSIQPLYPSLPTLHLEWEARRRTIHHSPRAPSLLPPRPSPAFCRCKARRHNAIHALFSSP